MVLLHCRKASYHDYRLGPSLSAAELRSEQISQKRASKIYSYFIDNKKSISVFLS